MACLPNVRSAREKQRFNVGRTGLARLYTADSGWAKGWLSIQAPQTQPNKKRYLADNIATMTNKKISFDQLDPGMFVHDLKWKVHGLGMIRRDLQKFNISQLVISRRRVLTIQSRNFIVGVLGPLVCCFKA